MPCRQTQGYPVTAMVASVGPPSPHNHLQLKRGAAVVENNPNRGRQGSLYLLATTTTLLHPLLSLRVKIEMTVASQRPRLVRWRPT
ncbi:hypothetical protein CRG98_031731 [Punica granatum]|uniref:Uncharacterized protein n=1 Tax=Punica granatum TaxID=22663 RepID=A0A2I0IVB9_PUNGR|nr:hypothetical protein CRG98_031731 [Punica granatum]